MNVRTVMVTEPGHRLPPRGERAAALAADLRGRIESGVVRPGARLPAVRQLAEAWGVSRFTAVEAYDRLVAAGWVEARRGAGFFARTPQAKAPLAVAAAAEPLPGDVNPSWLLKTMLRTCEVSRAPGAGLLPASWLDGELASRAIRAASREAGLGLAYGDPLGLLALREALSRKLADHGIPAAPGQIITALGTTHAIDLVARAIVRPGDTVLVDDPGFFLPFAILAARGARVIGVPWVGDGPDLAILERHLAQYRPRLYLTSASIHNPTGGALSPAKAFQVLRLTETAGTWLLEDDVYGDLATQAKPRLAALDGLNRVIYAASFSKTLAPGWRVGYLAAPAALVDPIVEGKMLSSITTPLPTEAAVAGILANGAYRRHVLRLRDRIARARARALKALADAGFVASEPAGEGLFIWARGSFDGQLLATKLWGEGILVAPGSLFSPSGAPSPWTRVNVAAAEHSTLIDRLAEANGSGETAMPRPLRTSSSGRSLSAPPTS